MLLANRPLIRNFKRQSINYVHVPGSFTPPLFAHIWNKVSRPLDASCHISKIFSGTSKRPLPSFGVTMRRTFCFSFLLKVPAWSTRGISSGSVILSGGGVTDRGRLREDCSELTSDGLQGAWLGDLVGVVGASALQAGLGSESCEALRLCVRYLYKNLCVAIS